MRQDILIAEPLEILRIGLRTIFLEDSRVSNIYEVATYEAFQTKLATSKVDLIVINQSLIEDISQLPGHNTVILTDKPDIRMLRAAYRHGVEAYLLDRVAAELLRTTLCSAPGTFLIDPMLASWIMKGIANTEEYEALTHQEREIVSLLNGGLDDITIARHLHITRATLKTHVKNINRKLNGSVFDRGKRCSH